MKPTENLPDRVITRAEAASIAGLSGTRIAQLAAAGWIPKPYTVRGVGLGVIRFLTDENRRSAKGAATLRKDYARTREIELRIAQREERLIDREETIGFVGEMIQIFERACEGIPDRVGADAALRAKITANLDQMFDRARVTLVRRAAELRTTGTIDAGFRSED